MDEAAANRWRKNLTDFSAMRTLFCTFFFKQTNSNDENEKGQFKWQKW